MYITLFTSKIVVLVYQWLASKSSLLEGLTIVAALIVILTIILMPMRNPHLPNEDIGSADSPPTDTLRSPEDSLTPWQFMTVSWMSTLISLGRRRQLNEADVWGLAYEFRHRYLHDAFRELRGSVVRRLLRANGIDLVILTFLGLIELAAGMD